MLILLYIVFITCAFLLFSTVGLSLFLFSLKLIKKQSKGIVQVLYTGLSVVGASVTFISGYWFWLYLSPLFY